MTTTSKTETGVPFTEDFPFPKTQGELVIFDGPSFQAWVDAALPQLTQLTPTTDRLGADSFIPLGRDRLIRKTMDTHYLRTHSNFGIFPTRLKTPVRERVGLKMFQSSRWACCAFTTPVHIPVLLDPVREEVWMSLTPMEIATCRSGIKRAFGRVLLGGMGLGWMASKILQRKQVSHLTIVDINKHVLDYFGEPLVQRYPDRVTLIHESVWKHLGVEYPDRRSWRNGRVAQPGDYDSYIMDVWRDYGRAEGDPDFNALKRYAQQHDRRCWGWGDVKNLPE